MPFAWLQFGATTAYRILFAPVSRGLAVFLALWQTAWCRPGNPKHLKMVKFWSKPFLICFAMAGGHYVRLWQYDHHRCDGSDDG